MSERSEGDVTVSASVEEVTGDERLRCFIWGALTDTSDATPDLVEKLDAVFRWIKTGERPGPRGELKVMR